MGFMIKNQQSSNNDRTAMRQTIRSSDLLYVLLVLFLNVALSQWGWADTPQQASIPTNTQAASILSESELYQFSHELLGVGKDKRGNAFNLFKRWERPVGYYLKGLEEHPDFEAKVVNKINEVV